MAFGDHKIPDFVGFQGSWLCVVVVLIVSSCRRRGGADHLSQPALPASERFSVSLLVLGLHAALLEW